MQTEAEYFRELYHEAEEIADKIRNARPTIHRHADGGYVWSVCGECGPDVGVDEDGCCVSCGRDALFFGKEGDERRGVMYCLWCGRAYPSEVQDMMLDMKFFPDGCMSCHRSLRAKTMDEYRVMISNVPWCWRHLPVRPDGFSINPGDVTDKAAIDKAMKGGE